MANVLTPSARSTLVKVGTIARTDNGTVKFGLPKGAFISGIYVIQTVAASTAAATVDIGITGDTDGLVNDFSMGTTSVGYSTGGAATGSAVGTVLTSDVDVVVTYSAGSSTAGGTGYFKVEYYMPPSGESY